MEANSADHRHPAVAPTMEVSKDEVETGSPAVRFQSVAFQAATQCIEETGAADAAPSPLHLSEWSYDFRCAWLFPLSCAQSLLTLIASADLTKAIGDPTKPVDQDLTRIGLGAARDLRL